MTWRSKERLTRPYWSMRRGLFKSMGYSDYDLDRPLVGIANSWNTVVSGHYNLRQVAESVRQGIYQAGGTPVEFGVIGGCDGLADGGWGARYMLPSRSLIADSVEMMVEAHHLDGVVLIGSCDKIVPGMLMAAARMDLPAILVAGGPSQGGCLFDGRASDNTRLNEALPMLEKGIIDGKTYGELENRSMPTCGSCSMLGTANSMCCIAEAMGMSLSDSAVIPATHAQRFQAAGGVPAVMKEILSLLHSDARTVTGKTIAANVATARSRNPQVIRSLLDPWDFQGGLAVLTGNLAPDGSIAKPSAINPEHRRFSGRAKCFDSEEDATQAIQNKEITPGTVVVVRYEGPKGGPGMPEMYMAMKFLCGQGLALTTALITDGRFSGSNNGCFVGHISPEAAEGGPIALVEEGDVITIDIPNGKLVLHVGDEVLKVRRKNWKPPKSKGQTRGFLNIYARLAESAGKGAIICHRNLASND